MFPPHAKIKFFQEWSTSGLVNILGGCCGTTPQHIRAIVDATKDAPPRKPHSKLGTFKLTLSGKILHLFDFLLFIIAQIRIIGIFRNFFLVQSFS